MRVLVMMAALAAASPAAAVDVLSAAAEKVSVVVYPSGGGPDIAMIAERRTVDLPAGPSRLVFRGVADTIVPQTAALQGLGGPIREQNFDYQLLTPGSLLAHSAGGTATLIRTNPKTGRETRQAARIISADNGVLLDTDGGIEALKCSDMPQRLALSGVPGGLIDKPTLSVDVVAPRAGRYTLVLSYLAGDIGWKANYVARLADDGRTLDLASWVTLKNGTDTTFPEAPIQVVAGRLARLWETQPPDVTTPRRREDCWRINSGRRVRVIPTPMAYRDLNELVVTGTFIRGVAEDAAIPVEVTSTAELLREDLGDYKLYQLGEPTTLAARQTKQVQMFERRKVAFDRAYRFSLTSRSGRSQDQWRETPGVVHQADVVLELQNEKDKGLGLPLPGGDVSVIQGGVADRLRLLGEDSFQDTPEGRPFEIVTGTTPLVTARRERTVKSVSLRRTQAKIEVVVSNAADHPTQVEVREAEDQQVKVIRESRRHRQKDAALEWRVSVPAHGVVSVNYVLEWDD